MLGRRTLGDPRDALAEDFGATVVARDLQSCRAMVVAGSPPEVSYRYDLNAFDRAAVLWHEYKHLQLELFHEPGAPAELVAPLERIVTERADEHQLPIAELVDWVARQEDAVTARDVHVAFGLALDVCERQCRRAAHRLGQSVANG